MTSPLVQKLTGVRDLKKILETTVKDLGEAFQAETCQIMLTNPLDPNVTSIYEFRAEKDAPQEILPTINMPLVLQGRTVGSLSLARYRDVSQDEVNTIRVILGELCDIIRHAQINDIVQRDTFRDTFLVEIGNVMAYSLGIGDALFMVVNILGKVLHASRCLFICTDDTQAGWKCYEYWEQEKVQSCQDYRWPTSASPLVAQTLLSNAPMRVYEGQVNSYVSPVQEELQFIGVKSLLGVALRSTEATHGCVILQQCDYRRAWTRNEIDMVQNVADKVAEALVKLPAEKRAREPIMQLHQRIVSTPEGDAGNKMVSAVSVRNALKGALGQQAIPTARKTSQPAIPPMPPPAPKPAAPVPAPFVAQPQIAAQVAPGGAPGSSSPFAQTASAAGAPTISSVQSRGTAAGNGQPPQPAAAAPGGSAKSLGSILGAARGGADTVAPPVEAPPPPGGKPGDPYADLDFGDFTDFSEGSPQPAARNKSAGTSDDPDSTWGNLQAMPAGKETGEPLTAPPSAPGNAPDSVVQSQFETMPPGQAADLLRAHQAEALSAKQAADELAPPGEWGNLDSIPTPKPASGGNAHWGDLDSIPTPKNAPSAGGLSGLMTGKARASSAPAPKFGRTRQAPPGESGADAAPAEPPPPPMDEATAEARMHEKLAAKQVADEISDYIFATAGLDPRMAGRISSWIQEIEEKDRYGRGHAKPVAEYAAAIAREAGLSQADVDTVRQAALLHDVGKRACAPQILQKRDDELSDPELIIMMKHPLDGAELLESFGDLKHLAPIVRAHHEEYDGNGYPQGLKGDEIPVAARIIAVANSYHSMTSPMCYGEGMAPEKAQEELVKGAGKQWDPTFVQALLQAVMSKKVPGVF